MKLNKTEAKIVKIGAIASITLFFGVQLSQAQKELSTESFNTAAVWSEEVSNCMEKYGSPIVSEGLTCSNNSMRMRDF